MSRITFEHKNYDHRSSFLTQRINWIFPHDIGIFYEDFFFFFLRAGLKWIVAHARIFIIGFISRRREKRSRSPPAGTLLRVASKYVSCARELVVGKLRLVYPSRIITNRVRPGATLHKHALSRSTAYAYAIKSVGNGQVKADRDTFADPNSTHVFA